MFLLFDSFASWKLWSARPAVWCSRPPPTLRAARRWRSSGMKPRRVLVDLAGFGWPRGSNGCDVGKTMPKKQPIWEWLIPSLPIWWWLGDGSLLFYPHGNSESQRRVCEGEHQWTSPFIHDFELFKWMILQTVRSLEGKFTVLNGDVLYGIWCGFKG